MDGDAVTDENRSDGRRPSGLRAASPEFLASGVLAVVTLTLCIVGAALSAQLYRIDAAAAIGLNVLHAAAIIVAVLRPWLAVTMATAGAFALMGFASFESGPWPWAVTWLLTHLAVLFMVAARFSWRIGAVCWTVSTAGSLMLALLLRDGHDLTSASSNVLLFASLSAAALATGAVSGQLVQTRARLRRERQVSAQEYAQRTLAQQKAQIARDLHDVIAHSMSLISIQAASAPARLGPLDEAVANEFDQIGASARQALHEMRQVLTVLRSDDETAEVHPAPSAAGIPALVEQARQAGLEVTLDWPTAATSELVGLAAYRIVQEALSNASRHAPGAAVSVRGSVVTGELWIDVITAPSAQSPAPPNPEGLGMLGMRERAKAAGGELDAGPTQDGGHAVTARLPLSATDDAP